MVATVQIDQVGLPAGTPGKSRTVGLANGAEVTLTNTNAGAITTRFVLNDVPLNDTTALGSLNQTAPNQFKFTPTPARYGSFGIELIENEGLASERRERRIFGIRLPSSGLLIPALNERADPEATIDVDSETTDASDDNAEDYSSAPLNARPNAGWWRKQYELYQAVENGGGGGGSSAPSDIYVSTTGSDSNDGLTPGTALLTVTAARLLIGDKDGDSIIHLIGDVGVDTDFTVSISDAGAGIWMRPRGGSGRITIQGDLWEDVATLNVLSNSTESVTQLAVVEVDATLTPNEYNYMFAFDVADTGLASPQAVSKTLVNKLYLASPFGFGGAQILIKRPRVGISFNTPLSVHCGHGAHVSPGNELTFDTCRPSGIFHDGRLLLNRAQLGYFAQFFRVEFTRETESVFSSLGTMQMDSCTAPQGTLIATIAYIEATNCGGVDANLSNTPFSIRGRVTFVNAWGCMLMISSYVDGDILSNIEDSKVVVFGLLDGFRSFDNIVRSTVTAVVKEEPDTLSSGVSTAVIGLASVLDISFDDAAPNLSAFSPQFKGGELRVNRDLSSVPLFEGLDFSDSVAAYRFPNGSTVCREGVSDAEQVQLMTGGIINGQSVGASRDMAPSYSAQQSPVPDSTDFVAQITLPLNRSHLITITTVATSPGGSISETEHKVKCSTDGTGITSISSSLEWSSVDDDLTDPVTAFSVAATNSGADLIWTASNISGGNLSMKAYFERKTWTKQAAP